MPITRPSVRPSAPSSAPSADAGAFEPGDVFGGRFRVVRKLATGGAGHVYEAENVWTNRRVALKLLRPERAEGRAFLRRFQLEGEAATRVAHPNVVEVIATGRDPETGLLFLAQEFLEGVDLDRFLRSHDRLPADRAMAIMAPVMRALQAAHERGVIHRDLKPENLFLARSPDGGFVPKVIDFGIARLLSDSVRLTEKGTVNGTPSYMSPEQILGESELDARTDVWSVGVIWYELLTGRAPFAGGDLHELFDRIVHAEPDDLAAAAPDVPPALAHAVHRALAKDPAARFASMADFLAAVTLACVPPEDDEPEVSLVVPRPRPSRRPTARARPAWWHVALPIIAVALVVPLAAWHLTRPRPAGAPPADTVRTALPLAPPAPDDVPPATKLPDPAPAASPPEDVPEARPARRSERPARGRRERGRRGPR